LGWHNQIKNDAAVDYQVNYERAFLSWKDHLSLSSYMSARLGTLSTKASVGAVAMIGNFNDAFTVNHLNKKKFQFYVYDFPAVSAIGYDATLQGGLFDRSSVYTIVLIFKRLYLEYYQSGPTQEFSTSVYHKSGGLQIGFGF
jgi:hypothetical protein